MEARDATAICNPFRDSAFGGYRICTDFSGCNQRYCHGSVWCDRSECPGESYGDGNRNRTHDRHNQRRSVCVPRHSAGDVHSNRRSSRLFDLYHHQGRGNCRNHPHDPDQTLRWPANHRRGSLGRCSRRRHDDPNTDHDDSLRNCPERSAKRTRLHPINLHRTGFRRL